MIKMYEVMDSKDQKVYSFDQMVDMHDGDELNYSYVSKRLCCPSCKEKVIKINIDDEVSTITSKRMDHLKVCDYYGMKLAQSKVKSRIKNKEGFGVEFSDILDKTSNVERGLPKKNLKRMFTVDDYGIYKAFYGRVFVKLAHTKDEERYLNYSFKAPYGDIVTLTIQKKDFIRLEKEISYLNSILDKEVYVLFLGVLKEVDQYNNLLLEHADMLRIKEINV